MFAFPGGIHAISSDRLLVADPVEQRIRLIEAAAGSGIPMGKFIAGAGSCAMADAVKVTRAATEAGAGGSWNQLCRHLAHRTVRPSGPTALSGTT
jgi:hypothetical protein